jgi:hypothetical protein
VIGIEPHGDMRHQAGQRTAAAAGALGGGQGISCV